jgi:hypothetical protein
LLTLATLSTEPLAPLWFVAPVTVATFFIVGAHLLSISSARMPASRRRIRIANSLLIMGSLPLLAYAMAIVPPADGRPFILCWMILAALVTLVMILAWIDVANNLRLARLERTSLIKETRTQLQLTCTTPVAAAAEAANDAPRAS